MEQHGKCRVDPIEKGLEPGALDSADYVQLGVSGMGCINCANRVRNALLLAPGVLAAEIDLPSGLATVAFDARKVDLAEMIAAVARAGHGTRHVYRAVPLAFSA